MTAGRRLWVYGGIGLAVYAGVLVATIPAAWTANALDAFSEQRLTLRDVAGSAWSGSGALYARQPSGDLIALGRLAWDISAASMLQGSLRARVYAGAAKAPMRLELHLTGLTIQDLDVEAPGAALGSIAPALHSLGPQGRIRVRSDKLRLDASSFSGLAEIEWLEAHLVRPQDIELGSHVARLRGGGDRVDIELATLGGPLQLAGRGMWTHQAGFSMAGSAEPRSPKVTSFLRSVCAEYRDARCTFRYPR